MFAMRSARQRIAPVTQSLPPVTHRFVVVYRLEAREIEGAAEVRRGWIERVPDPRALDAGEAERERLGFQALAELPDLIARMIDKAETPARAAPDRRPSA
jgi:hypothetical protein